MNLNENRRIENFEISDSEDLAGYLVKIVDSFFYKPFAYRVGRPDTRAALNDERTKPYEPKNKGFDISDVVIEDW